MSESILNDLCMSLIDSLQKAAKGLSNPTANEYHRVAWAKEAYAGAERALSTLISLGPLTTNSDESEPARSLEPFNGKGLTLKEISDWVYKCCRDPENNRWVNRVKFGNPREHEDAVAVACAALHDLSHHYNENNHCADVSKKVDLPCPLDASEAEVKDVIKVLKRVAENWQGYRNVGEYLKKAVELLEVKGEVLAEIPVDRSIRPTAPIPLMERFPEPVDCDNEGNFWAGRLTTLGWRWLIDCNPKGAMSDGYTHWLPFNTQWLPARSPAIMV